MTTPRSHGHALVIWLRHDSEFILQCEFWSDHDGDCWDGENWWRFLDADTVINTTEDHEGIG